MFQYFRRLDWQNWQVAVRKLAVLSLYRFWLVVAQQKSKGVAKNLVASLLKTCKHVQKNKGAAARG